MLLIDDEVHTFFFSFYFPLDEPFVVDLISILTVHLVTSVEKKNEEKKH